MGYAIKYKTKSGKWKFHTKKYSDIPIVYKTKEGATKAVMKHYFRLVYQTNKVRVVKYKKKGRK